MNSELSSPGSESAVIQHSAESDDFRSAQKSLTTTASSGLTFKIPPILLEGDDAPVSAAEDAQKFSLGAEAPAEKLESEGELPESYGTQKLLLTARDPNWLYAHWDLTPEQQREHCARSEDGKLTLRVYQERIPQSPVAEVHVHPDSRHWFVHVGKPATTFIAELGYKEKQGGWKTISASTTTNTPPVAMSASGPEQFATVPLDMPISELKSLLSAEGQGGAPLAEALGKLHSHPALLSAPPIAEWTRQQTEALAVALRGNMQVFAPSSLDILSGQSSWPTSPGISSPLGGMPARKNFWFNVNAELILYGSTEANAKVTIGGREIRLKPDGSFSFRFALPDGEYELPIVAVSADGTDGRAAEMKFTRATQLRGEVGRHPQDTGLKTPGAENV